jgi:hypothetical protein
MDYGLFILVVRSGIVEILSIRWIINRYKRPSAITALMSVVLGLAGIAIVIFGIISTVSKAERGILTAKFNDLCEGF